VGKLVGSYWAFNYSQTFNKNVVVRGALFDLGKIIAQLL
jgi:hypothetical protein